MDDPLSDEILKALARTDSKAGWATAGWVSAQVKTSTTVVRRCLNVMSREGKVEKAAALDVEPVGPFSRRGVRGSVYRAPKGKKS